MVFGGENANSYYDEGVTASMKGDLDRAIVCFEKAISFDYGFAAAYQQLAKCHIRLGNADRAVRILGKVLAHHPDILAARLDLGAAWLALNNPVQARQQFEHVLQLRPNQSRAMLGMAEAAFLEGNWTDALGFARRVVDQGARHFAALFMLGKAARLAEEFQLHLDALKEADAVLAKSSELNPDQPEAYYLRGEVHFAREDFSKALEFYREADQRADAARRYSAYGHNFCQLDIWLRQAFCFQRLGLDDRAREMAERVIEIDPDHSVANALLNQGGNPPDPGQTE